MAIVQNEIFSFISKFSELTNQGFSANLQLNSFNGKVFVNLRTEIGYISFPPQPPLHNSSSKSQSRRRRKRAKNINQNENVDMNVVPHDVEETSEGHDDEVHYNETESVPFSTVVVNNSSFSNTSETSKPTNVDAASAYDYPTPTASTPYHPMQNSSIESSTSLPLTSFSLSDFQSLQRSFDRSQEVSNNFTQLQKDREEDMKNFTKLFNSNIK